VRRILFIHQNFPGQFRHLAQALAAQGDEVVALAITPRDSPQGVKVIRYDIDKAAAEVKVPVDLSDFYSKITRGNACAKLMYALKHKGFTPDLVIAHPGWGESMFVKDMWPATKLILFLEFHYAVEGQDVGFDPEFKSANVLIENRARLLRIRNANSLIHLDEMDWAYSPTQWQKSTYPETYHSKIEVIFDGIDTQTICPNPSAVFNLPEKNLSLTKNDKVVTFVNRNLEPYRGYHQFARALPKLLFDEPNAQVVMVGTDGVSYGAQAPTGKTWKSIFWDEVKTQLTEQQIERVHFIGRIPRPQLTALLQISACHVYLTYPFVLSWSCVEALACGAPVVASSTAPVNEFIAHGENGWLVDFFNPTKLAEQVIEILSKKPIDPSIQKVTQRAANLVKTKYDLTSISVPQQLAMIQRVLA
jgi:glycosyltransferase involved in cell wall biosynthesis